jgi:hypothetical protein
MARALLAIALTVVLGGAHRTGSAGVTVALPRGFYGYPLRHLPGDHVTNPVERFAVASAPIRLGNGCNELSYRFAPTAVGIVLVEWRGSLAPARMPPRPKRFAIRIRPAPAIECWPGPGGGAQFEEHHRFFGVYLLVGKRASAATVRRADAVLDTLQVRP